MTRTKYYRLWGVFNYGILWATFSRRKAAIQYAAEMLGSEQEARDYLKRGALTIEKMVAQKRSWVGSPWSTKP